MFVRTLEIQLIRGQANVLKYFTAGALFGTCGFLLSFGGNLSSLPRRMILSKNKIAMYPLTSSSSRQQTHRYFYVFRLFYYTTNSAPSSTQHLHKFCIICLLSLSIDFSLFVCYIIARPREINPRPITRSGKRRNATARNERSAEPSW